MTTHGLQKTLLPERVEPVGYTLAVPLTSCCQQIIHFQYVPLKLDVLLKLDSNNCVFACSTCSENVWPNKALASKPTLTHEWWCMYTVATFAPKLIVTHASYFCDTPPCQLAMGSKTHLVRQDLWGTRPADWAFKVQITS